MKIAVFLLRVSFALTGSIKSSEESWLFYKYLKVPCHFNHECEESESESRRNDNSDITTSRTVFKLYENHVVLQ